MIDPRFAMQRASHFGFGTNNRHRIVDAAHIDRGSVTIVKFPCRVHEGFHGIWVPAT